VPVLEVSCALADSAAWVRSGLTGRCLRKVAADECQRVPPWPPPLPDVSRANLSGMALLVKRLTTLSRRKVATASVSSFCSSCDSGPGSTCRTEVNPTLVHDGQSVVVYFAVHHRVVHGLSSPLSTERTTTLVRAASGKLCRPVLQSGTALLVERLTPLSRSKSPDLERCRCLLNGPPCWSVLPVVSCV